VFTSTGCPLLNILDWLSMMGVFSIWVIMILK